MTNTNMRKGFTMIELIFVIVIIGILAAVAIPKLATTKDNAIAATCEQQVGQLVGEISQSYAAVKDYATWQTMTLDENITNITVGSTEGNGITNAAKTVAHGTGIAYNCDSVLLATLTPSLVGSQYQLLVTVEASPTSPAAAQASESIQAKQNGSVTKTYRF